MLCACNTGWHCKRKTCQTCCVKPFRRRATVQHKMPLETLLIQQAGPLSAHSHGLLACCNALSACPAQKLPT